jgi:hypothetical protein
MRVLGRRLCIRVRIDVTAVAGGMVMTMLCLVYLNWHCEAYSS